MCSRSAVTPGALLPERDGGARALPQDEAMARSRRLLLPAMLGAGAIALLSSGCASSLGLATPCSVWVSMDNADQQATIISMVHQNGGPTPSSYDVSQTSSWPPTIVRIPSRTTTPSAAWSTVDLRSQGRVPISPDACRRPPLQLVTQAAGDGYLAGLGRHTRTAFDIL